MVPIQMTKESFSDYGQYLGSNQLNANADTSEMLYWSRLGTCEMQDLSAGLLYAKKGEPVI